MCRRVRARWRVTSSKSMRRPPPASLARYMAASASRISSSTFWSGSAERAMPRLADDVESPWARWKGVANERSTRSPTAIASCSSLMSSQRIANSSPPKRATVSCRRSEWRRRSATATISLSPARVAEAVVDDLEAVEVEEEDGDVAAAAALEALERLAQAVVEQQPARQAGQRVAQQLVLVRAPGDDVGGAGGEHEAAVDERPAPRVGDGVVVAVDRLGRDQAAERRGASDDVADRDQERASSPGRASGRRSSRRSGSAPRCSRPRGARAWPRR